MAGRRINFQTVLAELVHYMDLRPLKPKQLEAMQSFVMGNDTYIALPTGYSKILYIITYYLLLYQNHIKLYCISD